VLLTLKIRKREPLDIGSQDIKFGGGHNFPGLNCIPKFRAREVFPENKKSKSRKMAALGEFGHLGKRVLYLCFGFLFRGKALNRRSERNGGDRIVACDNVGAKEW